MRNFAAALLASAALSASAPAVAQQMSQGQAHITTRSDVRLSLESTPGTSAARLAALGRAVGGAMPDYRSCYARTVAARPTITGTMRLRVALAARGGPEATMVEDGPADDELRRCVLQAIGRVPATGLERPAEAIVVLAFTNEAAAGAAETARRADEIDEVPITRDGGRPTARGEARGVRYAIRGAAGTGDALVAEGFRVVRSQLAGMLDCRRRASRRGQNPAGTIVLSFQMAQGAAPVLANVRSTVADRNAPQCLAETLARPHRTPEAGPATLELEVEFAPAD